MDFLAEYAFCSVQGPNNIYLQEGNKMQTT